MAPAVVVLAACAGEAPEFCPGVPPARTVYVEEAEDPLVSDFAVEADSIFWVNFRANEVRRVSKLGGSAETIAQAGAPQRIAIDEQNVYWVGGLGGVSMVSKAGGPVTAISPDIECSAFPCGHAIAVDAGSVYWAADTHLMSWPKPDGAPVELEAPDLYTGDLVVDADHIYWGALVLTDSLSFELRASPKAGGAFRTIGVLPEETYWLPYAMAGDAENLYVARHDGVWRFPKDGTGAVQITADPLLPRSITTDGVTIYISEAGRILRIPTTGGELEFVACEQMEPRHLTVDATDLYWNAEGANAILSTPK